MNNGAGGTEGAATFARKRAYTFRRLCTCKAGSGCWHASACRNWSNFRHQHQFCRQTCLKSTFVGT
eukprot:scaffold103471_cov72-Phaeocystis_antarctica.AAC.7